MVVKKFWPIGILLILNFIFFFKLLAPSSLYTSADFGRGDLTHFHYPLKVFLSESLKKGQLPLWSDDIFGGFPVFSEGQIGTFYLPNLVLFRLLPTWLAFNLGLVVTFLIAGIGTFCYLRFLKFSQSSSLLGSIGFSFSFFFIGHIIHYNLIQVASLVPLTILFWERFLAKKALFDLAIFAFLVSQSIFASFTQITFYGMLTVLAITIFRVWYFKLFEKFRILSQFILALIFSFLLSAVQILASFEFVELSSRGFSIPNVELAKYPFSPPNIINFFSPFFFGDPSQATYPPFGPSWGIFWENASYFGIIPVVLAIIGIYFVLKNKLSILKFWLIFGFIVFLLVLGKFGPFFFLLELPPFSFFRVPSRFLFLVIFSACIICVFALEKLTKKFKLKETITFILALITFFDLYFLGVNYNGGAPIQTWLKPPDTAKFLQQEAELLRIYTIGQFENWNTIYKTFAGWRSETADKFLSTRAILDSNTNIIWGIPSEDGYAATQTRRSSLVKEVIDNGIDKAGEKIKISSASARLLTQQGVSHLITTKEINNPNFTQVFQSNWGDTGSKYYIYKSLAQAKLVKIVFEPVLVSTVAGLSEKLTQIDFTKQVIIEEELPLNLKPGVAETKLLKAENRTWEVEVKLDKPGLLVASNSWYPGWQAKINGRKAKILKANGNSKGVLLPAGESKIVFYYTPYWIKLGGAISAFSHLLLFFLIGLKILPKKVHLKPQSWQF